MTTEFVIQTLSRLLIYGLVIYMVAIGIRSFNLRQRSRQVRSYGLTISSRSGRVELIPTAVRYDREDRRRLFAFSAGVIVSQNALLNFEIFSKHLDQAAEAGDEEADSYLNLAELMVPSLYKAALRASLFEDIYGSTGNEDKSPSLDRAFDQAVDLVGRQIAQADSGQHSHRNDP